MSNSSSFKDEAFKSAASESSEKTHDSAKNIKQPEFILIDDRDGKSQFTHFGPDLSKEPLDSMDEDVQESASNRLSLRFLCFLGFIFCLIFGVGVLILSIVLSVLATCALFQKSNWNEGALAFWKIFTQTFFTGLGFSIGLINPKIGLSLIALFFSLLGDQLDENLQQIVRRFFP